MRTKTNPGAYSRRYGKKSSPARPPARPPAPSPSEYACARGEEADGRTGAIGRDVAISIPCLPPPPPAPSPSPAHPSPGCWMDKGVRGAGCDWQLHLYVSRIFHIEICRAYTAGVSVAAPRRTANNVGRICICQKLRRRSGMCPSCQARLRESPSGAARQAREFRGFWCRASIANGTCHLPAPTDFQAPPADKRGDELP